MKIKILLGLIFSYNFAFGQGDFSFLNRELNRHYRKDTVLIFGSLNDYSGNYVISSKNMSRILEIEYIEFKGDEYIKKIDSQFSCIDCQKIWSFVSENFNAISLDIERDELLWSELTIDGKVVKFAISSHSGPAYFLGIYANGVLNYSFFEKRKNINDVYFAGGQYYWIYFNLLKNQWTQYK